MAPEQLKPTRARPSLVMRSPVSVEVAEVLRRVAERPPANVEVAVASPRMVVVAFLPTVR